MNRMTSNQYIRNIWLNNEPLGAANGVVYLWMSAVNWSVELGRDSSGYSGESGDVRQRRFRQMIRLAAHHRAHAEWLVNELYELEDSKLRFPILL
jgi:hypothetical protein